MGVFLVATLLFSAVLSAQARLPNHWQKLSHRSSGILDIEFDCKESGRFPHPHTCSQYIDCDAQLVANTKDCPPCTDPDKCLDTKLHYNDETKTCQLAVTATCPWPTTTTTTPRPTTDSGKVPCEVNCTETGFCACYDLCVPDPSSPTGGYIEKLYCDYDLYWNPDAITSSAHGGSCDFWDNLSPALQELYRAEDPKDCPTPALPCEWKEDDKNHCDNKYYYRPEASVFVPYQYLSCPDSPDGEPPLYWNQAAKTCGFECPRDPNPCKYC